MPAPVRSRRGAASPFEQGVAEMALQRCDVIADSRLRNPELIGGLREAAGARRGYERTQLPECEIPLAHRHRGSPHLLPDGEVISLSL